MDDLAPAPMQRTSDDAGGQMVPNLAARKKSPRKAQPPPVEKPDMESDSAAEAEPGHQLDLLA